MTTSRKVDPESLESSGINAESALIFGWPDREIEEFSQMRSVFQPVPASE